MKLGKLTYRHLRENRACESQKRLFRQTFPRGFTPTKENFLLAANVGLSVDWAGFTFLNSDLYHELADKVNHLRWGPGGTGFSEDYDLTFAHVWWEKLNQELTA
jgi:hypothetical protein